jgi:diguanylate cyclase (GGDEF)-like protein/PAS domain S-box-containing protein
MPRLTDLVEIHETAHTRFSEPEQERAARLAAMWSRAAEMFREPELFRQILDEIDEGVCFVGSGERVLFWNRAAEEISGLAGPEVVGREIGGDHWRDSRRHGCERCAQGCPARLTANGRTLRSASVLLRHKAGHWLPVHMRKSPMLDGNGRIVGEVRLFRTASHNLACTERLLRLNQRLLLDRLTGLGNRRFLEGSLTEALTRQEREGQPFAVLLADIDGLADVNWIRGQASGDASLRVTASSLSAALRRFDLLGRWGDSVFAAIVEGMEPDALTCLASRLSELVAWSRIHDDTGEFRMTLSVGACYAASGDTLSTLMHRAETHLREAKALGHGRISVH